jgi:hypothetical protein
MPFSSNADDNYSLQPHSELYCKDLYIIYRYTTSILNIFLKLLELLPRDFKNTKLNYEVVYQYTSFKTLNNEHMKQGTDFRSFPCFSI